MSENETTSSAKYQSAVEAEYDKQAQALSTLTPLSNNIASVLESFDRIVANFKRGTSMADLAAMYRVSIRDIEAIIRFAFRLKS